jgi:hypothetical protein
MILGIEQRRIVAYLDGLQAKVNTLRELQAESEKELSVLMSSILAKVECRNDHGLSGLEGSYGASSGRYQAHPCIGQSSRFLQRRWSRAFCPRRRPGNSRL